MMIWFNAGGWMWNDDKKRNDKKREKILNGMINETILNESSARVLKKDRRRPSKKHLRWIQFVLKRSAVFSNVNSVEKY